MGELTRHRLSVSQTPLPALSVPLPKPSQSSGPNHVSRGKDQHQKALPKPNPKG